ncbi:hypothetical protein [Magnetospirillum fulvum]|uniref:Uncharacterized protein n=1 Tax=Magnetospirillum fulvum MGU-K5 TaxID=1316936 RepID=S9TYX9_MAGFU|nr:hypothetical protein [Magnetospirillum fulvum]EPY03520.1 hypothetical protein K678_00375 [Magnetospirillum fulvum MGU-K5]
MDDTWRANVDKKLDHLGQVTSEIRVTLAQLPTKRDLTTNTLAGLGLGLALMGIVIGGIIGGLSWIKPDSPPSTPQPIVIQVPQQAVPTPSQLPASKR